VLTPAETLHRARGHRVHIVDRHAKWRQVKVTDRKTNLDFAVCMRDLVDFHDLEARRIRVVLDHLSTHKPAARYEAFEPQEGRRILRRIEFHHTPKHASTRAREHEDGARLPEAQPVMVPATRYEESVAEPSGPVTLPPGRQGCLPWRPREDAVFPTPARARERYFTPEEAHGLLPEVRWRMDEIRELAQRHRALREALREALRDVAPGGIDPAERTATARAATEARDRAQVLLDELGELGVEVKGIEPGLIDFPALHHGHEVLLCWRSGEPAVAWWHPQHTGAAGRQPLDPADAAAWGWWH